MTDQISALLDALGTRFGATGVHLWEVLVRQQIIEGVYALGWFLGAGVGSYLYYKLLKYFYNQEGTYWDDWQVGTSVGLGICLLIIVIIGLVMTYDILGLINPEFYALKELLP